MRAKINKSKQAGSILPEWQKKFPLSLIRLTLIAFEFQCSCGIFGTTKQQSYAGKDFNS